MSSHSAELQAWRFLVGERWIVDRLEIEVGGGRSFEVGPLWKTATKPSVGARAARPDLRAWSSLELLKPWKLNTTGMATPCAVSGTTMSYARSIPSCRNDSDRDPGDTPSLHHALSTPGAIAVGVDVAGLPWVGDPSGSPVVGLHAPAITTANRMGEAIPTDSLHRRSIS